ncbi:MAG TPA: TIGR03899 family protein [Alteromonas sp.]|nr:TIGR03899 family protein [Alteromonas sp.]HCB09440.1 TIGR03899 family protein [Alteromonas sp.]HCL12238.1 TIGR03899 family protein [Alteromonas sp.]HCV17471.1 TIGR03899 family protein [Alteromonas sp.]|tara:strand:+ start:2765 stop:3667 length:903 start_codon:yes stop_codon:yes gene_type:complete
MKIPTQTTAPTSTAPASKERKVPKPSADSPESTKRRSTQHSSSTQHRISHWFASIGIEPTSGEYTAQPGQQVNRYHRMREQKRLTNLQQIMAVALSVSTGDQAQERLDPDWFHSFISMAENIYSPTMQELWGKILAVEVQRPGSFSLRSLETLTKLTQRDAGLFSQACQVACRRNNDTSPVIITGYHQQPGLLNVLLNAPAGQTQLAQFGLSYTDILALGGMKLLYATEIETGLLDKGTSMALKFATQSVNLTAQHRNILMTYYKFTSVGSELSRLLPKQNAEPFVAHLKSVFTPHFRVE